jgi:hypothetical protein
VVFREAEQRFLLLFLEKKKSTKRLIGFWGQAPRPPGSASPSFGLSMAFREAEQHFLLLFLEKEEYHGTNWFLCRL